MTILFRQNRSRNLLTSSIKARLFMIDSGCCYMSKRGNALPKNVPQAPIMSSGVMEVDRNYNRTFNRGNVFPTQVDSKTISIEAKASKIENEALEVKIKGPITISRIATSQDGQEYKSQDNTKPPSFIERARKKANQFKLVEVLDKKRKQIESCSRDVRYMLSLDEVYPGQGADGETQLKLLLQYSPGLAQPPSQMIALDCEMVGCGPRGSISKLGRVSLVDYYGKVVYDSFVFQSNVTDYRTWISGIKASDLKNAPSFSNVQRKVKEHIQGLSVVGHSLKFDFQALELPLSDFECHDIKASHTWLLIPGKSSFSLRTLAFNLLGIKIQTDNHSSIIDAQASMAVYRKVLNAKSKRPARKPHQKRDSSITPVRN